MDLDELKQLAQESEEVGVTPQDIWCEVCDCHRRQMIYQYQAIQLRICQGTSKGGKHTLYFDPKGKYLWAVEHHDGRVDWRVNFDHARTEGVKPQTMAWETDRRPRRKGGRKKGGSGWTDYVEDKDD